MTASAPIVRLATRADEGVLMELCRALHTENGLFQMDDGMVRDMLARAFDRTGAIIGVIDGEKTIDAVILILISSFWYSRDNHLEELFSYVRPECRRSNHAKLLIAFAQECADKIGIPLVIGVLTNQRMVEKVRLYRRTLGMPAGAFFVYGAEHWQDQRAPDFTVWQPLKRSPRKRNGAAHLLGPAVSTTTALPVLPLSQGA